MGLLSKDFGDEVYPLWVSGGETKGAELDGSRSPEGARSHDARSHDARSHLPRRRSRWMGEWVGVIWGDGGESSPFQPVGAMICVELGRQGAVRKKLKKVY